MKKEPKFKIGQSVLVTKTAHFGYEGANKRKLYEVVVQRTGIISGATHRLLGTRDWDSDYGGMFYPNGSVLVWQIKEGYLNKPIEALEENIIALDDPIEIPWKFDEQWTKAAREDWSRMMKKSMKDYPRDEKGRFVQAIYNWREKKWEKV